MSQKTARFQLTEPRYIQQIGEGSPRLIDASPAYPAVVVLDAATKERGHLKRLADGEEPKAEKLKPAHAGITSGSNSQSAADFYSKPKAEAPAAGGLPVEGGKKAGRTADRD